MLVKVTTCCGCIQVSPQHLHIEKGEKVRWVCDAGRLEVKFEHGSPFEKDVFTKTASEMTVFSGSQLDKVELGIPYKYTVTVWKGGTQLTPLDPEVVVDPPPP